MPYLIRQYERAAKNAAAAEFDGIEIHAANGYLIDQFIESSTNRRSDAYGDTVQNRVRLLLEITEALIPILGADRIGVRLSPLGKMNDISDDAPESTFGYLAEQLSGYGLAYLHIVNPALEQIQNGEKPGPYALNMARLIRNKYQGTLIVAGGFNADSATQWLRDGQADLIAFGSKFIANPDLPERLRVDAPLNVDDPTTYYGGGEKVTRTILHRNRTAAKKRRPVSTSVGDDAAEEPVRMRILIVLTSNDQLGNTGRKTGFWFEEFAAVYYIFKNSGAARTLASPNGGLPPVDPRSERPEMQTEAAILFQADGYAQAELANTRTLSSISVSDCDAVFYPGGHGLLWDLASDPHSITIIETLFYTGRPVALVSHGAGALRYTRAANGRPLVADLSPAFPTPRRPRRG
jgi:putative intracellular protease/amidase